MQQFYYNNPEFFFAVLMFVIVLLLVVAMLQRSQINELTGLLSSKLLTAPSNIAKEQSLQKDAEIWPGSEDGYLVDQESDPDAITNAVNLFPSAAVPAPAWAVEKKSNTSKLESNITVLPGVPGGYRIVPGNDSRGWPYDAVSQPSIPNPATFNSDSELRSGGGQV